MTELKLQMTSCITDHKFSVAKTTQPERGRACERERERERERGGREKEIMITIPVPRETP